MNETARIVFYGLVAAASTTTMLAVLAVLLSTRGRANGIAFAAGFLLGSVAAFLTAFFVGSTISKQHHGSVRSYAELALGAVLLAVAWRARGSQKPTEAGGRSGMDALFGKLEHVRPVLSFSLGAALGVGTKRLIITAVAATTVALAGLSPAEKGGLGVLYLVLGGIAVWFSVTVYLIAGKRADDWIATASPSSATRSSSFCNSRVG